MQKVLEKLLMEYLKIDFCPYIEIVHDYEKIKLHMDSIVYMEKCMRVTEIHTVDGKVYRCYRPMHKFEEILPSSMFYRISCSAIINWRFLYQTRAYRATLRWNTQEQELAMSPKNYKWVKAECIRRNGNAGH